MTDRITALDNVMRGVLLAHKTSDRTRLLLDTGVARVLAIVKQ